MKYCAYLASAILCSSIPCSGEVLHLKNGDRLTGTWVRVVGSTLTFRAEAVGDVAVPIAKVRSLRSEQSAVVLAKDGRAYGGELSLLDSGEWELSENGGARQVAAASVEAIYPAEIYQPEIEGRRSMPWHHWKGKGNLGYNLVRGDRDAGTLSVGVNATRRQPELPGLKEMLRSNFFLTMLLANTRRDGIKTSANSLSSGLRQDFLFSPSNFFFVLTQYDHIQTQGLDLRQTYGGGLGRDLVRKPRIALSLLGGVTFVRENFETEVDLSGTADRSSGEALLGEKLRLNLTDWVSFEHYLNFYPNLSNRGEYRVDTTSTLSTRVSPRLSFNTTLTNRILSNPPLGRQEHELVLTTGLGISF